MKKRAVYADLVRYFLVLPLAVAAACASGGGESSGVGSEQQVDGSASAGAPGSQNEPGEAPQAAGGDTSKPDPIASGNVGSVGEEPENMPEQPNAGGGGSPDASGEAGAGGETAEPAGPSEAFLRGEELVKQNACVTCHQADYAGFTVFPNITPDAETGIGSWSDAQIIDAIRGGRDADGSTLCVTMQRYSFSDDQVADVVAFLRGIRPVSRRIASVCPGHGQ
jgi:mono/diheme cytochrome c family protein